MNELIKYNLGNDKLFIQTYPTEQSFKKIINDIKFKQNINIFLDSIFHTHFKYKNYTQKFILAFLINYHTNAVFTQDELFIPLYFISKSLIKYFNLYIQCLNDINLNNFKTYFDIYLDVYDKWIDNNKENEIKKLLMQYFDLTNTINNTNSDIERLNNLSNLSTSQNNLLETSKEITIHLNNRLKQVKIRLNGYQSMHLIDVWISNNQNSNYSEIIHKIKNSMLTGFEYNGQELEVIGKKAFYHNFYDILKKNPLDDSICLFLNDLKTKIKLLIPINCKSLHNDINEYLDITYISQMISNNVFDSTELYKLIINYTNTLKELDSIDNCKYIDYWIDDLNVILKCDYKTYELIPYILRDLMNKTERMITINKAWKKVLNIKDNDEIFEMI